MLQALNSLNQVQNKKVTFQGINPKLLKEGVEAIEALTKACQDSLTIGGSERFVSVAKEEQNINLVLTKAQLLYDVIIFHIAAKKGFFSRTHKVLKGEQTREVIDYYVDPIRNKVSEKLVTETFEAAIKKSKTLSEIKS